MTRNDESRSALLTAANEYRAGGLCALPAHRTEKRPAVGSWKPYQTRPPTEAEWSAWWANGQDAVCLLCGQASGNLEIIDFDVGAELFSAWWDRIPVDLRDRLVVESTQSGGRHVVYRCESEVCGNVKLAQRPRVAADDDLPATSSRSATPHVVTLIETRGEGGLFLCAPTAGYELTQGDLADPPVLTEADRATLLTAAWELNEYSPESGPSSPLCDWNVATARSVAEGREPSPVAARDRPGDDYNARGDVVALLEKHGWRSSGVRSDGNHHWTRPGKPHGTSATLKDSTFYVFSSNAAPFEPNKAYSPFGVLVLLEHAGDYEAAARELGIQGYGHATPSDDVDISGILFGGDEEEESSAIADPGPIPEHLFDVPGFVAQVMKFTLSAAPYPNIGLAFCGAMALQSFLAGRKVCTSGDLRTNIYLLALASSGAGKEFPRKVNSHVLYHVGLTIALGDKFASGEGIQDALVRTGAMLFQNDEMDGVLRAMRCKASDFDQIVGTLLQQGDIIPVDIPTKTKPAQGYQIA